MINELMILLDLAKKNLTIYNILIWVLIFGILSLSLHYYSKLKKSHEKWEKMKTLDKILFIILLGVFIVIPSFFISSIIIEIIFIVGVFFNHYLCGEVLGSFKIIFVTVGVIYTLFNQFIIKKELGWASLRDTRDFSILFFVGSFILSLIGLIISVVLGIFTKCVVIAS